MCDPHEDWARAGYPDAPPFRCVQCGQWDWDCECDGGAVPPQDYEELYHEEEGR